MHNASEQFMASLRGLYLEPSFKVEPNGTLEPLKAGPLSLWFQSFRSFPIPVLRDAWTETLPFVCKEAGLICKLLLMRCARGLEQHFVWTLQGSTARCSSLKTCKASAQKLLRNHIWSRCLLTNHGPRQAC